MRSSFDRLRALEVRTQKVLEELAALGRERQEIIDALASLPKASRAPPQRPQRAKDRKVVPLPMGKPIAGKNIKALKAEIALMAPEAFDSTGRDFIRLWYPRLCNTPAWHELSTAMQAHFHKRRQQIAGVAARIARVNGEEHARA